MSPFEKQFICECLKNIKQILQEKTMLTKAIGSFTNNDLKNPRYLLTTKITDAIFWSIDELIQFSAAYSEGLCLVMKANSTKENHELHSASQLLENYIRKITSGTKIYQRISSVIENCDVEIKELEQKKEKNYSFFSSKQSTGLLISAAVASAAMAVLLTRT